MYFWYLKIKCKRSVPTNILFLKLQRNTSNASESRWAAIRQTLKACFSKLYFSTRLAIELEQFLPARLEISTVSVRLNYLQKDEWFFWYVENCSSYKAFFTIFLRETDFFQNDALFQKSIFSKTATYFCRYFYIENEEIYCLVPGWKLRQVWC